jgi:microcystin-dependent protein
VAIQFTANFQLPYPATDRSDTADIPRDFQALANKLDTVLLAARRDDLIGEVKLWPIAAPPASFVICDGSLLDRLGTYNRLYQAIGLTYSEGGIAADKFRIPDARGRSLIGVDGSAGRITGNDALGSAGGAETAPLQTVNLPSHVHPDSIAYAAAGAHNHGLNDPSHYHLPAPEGGYFATYASGSGLVYYSAYAGNGDPRPGVPATGIAYTGITINGVGDHGHAKSGGVLPAGSGVEHPNLSPYLVINYIIRYA